jgi:type I restriction-modification system DNA methylase subunit
VPRKDDDSKPASQLEWVLGVALAKELNVKPPVLGNWRNRYPDFPPTKKSGSGLFLYNRAEVLRWFKSHEQESPTTSLQIWNLVNSMRGSLDEGEFLLTGLAMLSMIKLGKKPPTDNCKDRQLAKTLGETGKVLLNVFDLWEYRDVDLDSVWNKLDGVQVEDIPLWLQTFDNLPKGRFSQDTTADPINELIVNLVEHVETTVFDPTVGQGRTLLRVAKEIHGRAEGQELNPRSREICILRAFLLDVPVKIELGDSLTDDGFSSEHYEVVVADPPMGLKLSDRARAMPWPLGQPRTLGDWAWAQHIVLHLAKNGEGYLNLSSGALVHGQSSEIRREMIRRGCIEAVISLPPLATSARIPLALLCLRAPDIKTGVGVLMIDASDISSRGVKEFASNIPNIVNKVKAFRANPDSVIADEQSMVVPVLDLLEGECSLVPARYIARARKSEAPYTGELRPLLESLRSSANNVALHLSDASLEGFKLTHVPLKTLRLKEMADIISGVRIDAEIRPFEKGKKPTTPGAQAVLTVRILRKPGPLLSTEYIEEEQLHTRAVTQPGDIVITRIGESQAKVDAKGGNLVLAPLSILRLESKFDPYVVAAALNGDHVRKLTTGAGIGRVDLDMLEIPQITIEQAHGLRETLLQIEQLEADVEEVRQQLVKWHKVGGDYLATASEVNL